MSVHSCFLDVVHTIQSSTVKVNSSGTSHIFATGKELMFTMMSGAPCEDGTFCDTGRADATGGYCTPIAQVAGMTPTSAPAPAPSGESTPAASTQANQECSATGMSWPQLLYLFDQICIHACTECICCLFGLPPLVLLNLLCRLQSKQNVQHASKADIASDMQDRDSFSIRVGNGCGNGQTCLSLDDGVVCSPNSKSACQCYDEELPEGSRCDLYGKQMS